MWLNPLLPREGRYVLGPLLGKGGMGEVLEAWDVMLCRTVALKALRNMDPAALIRFMHEAQIQARVIHPNICRIYDIEIAEGTLRIAMQLIKGPNLEQAAAQLALEEAVEIIRQMADAVEAAHRVNLIHRDLKPSNIILERGPEGRWMPYLCDFGLAVSVGEPAMTLSRAVVGTPAFMAPEQARGTREDISPATDVYALGGTLHYALLGCPPSQTSLAGEIRRSGRTTIPPDLATVIRKCLEPSPFDRYPTAAALAEDLGRFLQGKPVKARPVSRLDNLLRLLPQRGYRLSALAWFLAALGLTTAAGLGWNLAARNREEAQARELQVEATRLLWTTPQEFFLPVHDLRPGRTRLRTRIGEILDRAKDAGPRVQGAAWLAAGEGHLLLDEPEAARASLEQAASLGYDVAPLAPLMVRALAESAYWRPEAPFSEQARRWARLARREAGSDLLQQALAAYVMGDYGAAARIARELGERTSHVPESAQVEAAALGVLGRRAHAAGDVAGARALFQEGAAVTWSLAGHLPSDIDLRHAHARSALALMELDLERRGDGLAELARRCDEALRLEPENPGLRQDWLASRFLLARQRADLQGDPRPVLEEALAFLASPTQAPADACARAGRMLICWQMADFEFRHGRDPEPALSEALRHAGPTPGFNRDYLGDLLILKARVDAAEGRDPRPALDRALEGIGPARSWDRAETAAQAWLVRAEWEAGHALDPAASLAQAHALADQALGANPAAPSANALKGLALAVEMRRDPARRPLLMPAAQRYLKAARGAEGDLAGQLERALPGLS